MDYHHGGCQDHEPIWPNFSWLAQAMGGQPQINASSSAPQSSVHEFHRPAVSGPALYLDEMYYCPGAADPSIQNQPNGVDRQDISQPVQYPFVVVHNVTAPVSNHQILFHHQLSYTDPQQQQQQQQPHVEPVTYTHPTTISPSLTISHSLNPHNLISHLPLTRSELAMTCLTPTPICTPPSYQSPSDSEHRTLDLLAQANAFLRDAPNHDPSVEDPYPFRLESILPLEYPILDARRLSVDSDGTYTSHFSGSSNSSATVAPQDDVTLVESPGFGNLTAVCVSGPACEAVDDVAPISSGTPAQTCEVDSPRAPSIFRSHSPPPCMLNRRSMTPGPVPPEMPGVLDVETILPPSVVKSSLAAVVEGMMSPRMHSAPPSQIAESEDLPKDKQESEAPVTNTAQRPPLAAKKGKFENEKVEGIVWDWAAAPDPASVAKTRRRKQTSGLPTMSSHRMPSHFKKRSRAPRKTSSHTPSKTPSPPPSSFVDTRSPSPFIPIPTPPIIEPTPPSLPPPAIDRKPSIPLRAKPAHPRRSRVMKPAAISRASPAHHPATGRPSKACLFCRRRKIGCTQSETSKDSCQQCIDRHLTCEYPPDVQLAALTHASSSSSLVSRRTRREIKRESM